ncbi:uncharacterized protein LOC117010908 [Catharus ustulatus]|uniref:uncharacterized protein LOC117010908 n=1 Tax=Catharus ustulatus TaxID=91951 RepID=UPI001C5A91A4|nr:uncharacterized protein LOC117010908 [Catharus ustulatus]
MDMRTFMCRELCAHSSLEQGTPVRRSQRWGHRTRCCPGWTSLVSDSESLGGRGASASPAQLRTGKSITLLPSLPKAVVFEQPKPRGFSTRALPWRAPGPAHAVGEKNTNSQPFGPDSPLQPELSTHPQSQVQHLKGKKQTEGKELPLEHQLCQEPAELPRKLSSIGTGTGKGAHPCLQHTSSGTHLQKLSIPSVLPAGFLKNSQLHPNKTSSHPSL